MISYFFHYKNLRFIRIF